MSQIFTESAADLNGVLTLTGNSGGAVGPSTGNINVVGSGSITITGSPGTNTLTISDTEVAWGVIGASQTLVINHGYVCTTGAALSLLLPATSAVGSVIEVTLDGSTSFIITQGAGQQVRLGNLTTTAGIGGTITSTQQGDSLKLVCSVQNLKWNCISMIGNPIVV